MNVEELFEKLLSEGNARRKNSLKIINTICSEQMLRNNYDFSIATIGKLSKLKGGPSEQAIRNKNGEVYRLLITTWSNTANKKNKPVLKDENFNILQHIPNPSIRAEIGLLLAEIKQLRGENRILKGLNKDTIIIDRTVHLGNHLSNKELADDNVLTKSEKYALEQAINIKSLLDNGWQVQDNGSILNEYGRKIFEVSFLSAIKKTLKIND